MDGCMLDMIVAFRSRSINHGSYVSGRFPRLGFHRVFHRIAARPPAASFLPADTQEISEVYDLSGWIEDIGFAGQTAPEEQTVTAQIQIEDTRRVTRFEAHRVVDVDDRIHEREVSFERCGKKILARRFASSRRLECAVPEHIPDSLSTLRGKETLAGGTYPGQQFRQEAGTCLGPWARRKAQTPHQCRAQVRVLQPGIENKGREFAHPCNMP